MKIRLAVIACVVFVFFSKVAAQDKPSEETIKINTALVSVPVIVSDRDGRRISGLTSADFDILQDGVRQKIEFFAAAEEPINIALLIDTSESARPVLDGIKESAKSFVKLLGPRDRAMIVAFDYDAHILSPLTSDHDQLNRGIKLARIGEFLGTQMRDVVLRTVTDTFGGLTGRKAIILLTDGKDTTSQITIPNLLYSLQETDTLIYTVMFETGGGGFILMPRPDRGMADVRYSNSLPQPPHLRLPLTGTRQNARARVFLQKLSDTTAGRFYSNSDGKLDKTFGLIVDELRFQYRLGFYPPEEIGEKTLHELKVKVARPETAVRARSSYRTKNTPN